MAKPFAALEPRSKLHDAIIATRANDDLVVGEGKIIRSAAQDIAEILTREEFIVTHLSGRFQERGLDDIRLLETLWNSELCIFMLGERLSDAHLALAIAHADCIPSIRLQYSKATTDVKPNPTIAGVFHWSEPGNMLFEFQEQISSFKEGLIRPVEMAQESSSEDAAKKWSTMKWRARADNFWDLQDYYALIQHVYPEHSFVQDEVNRVRREFNQPFAQAERSCSKYGDMSIALQRHFSTSNGLRDRAANGHDRTAEDSHAHSD